MTRRAIARPTSRSSGAHVVVPVDVESEEVAAAYAIGDRDSALAAAEILDGTDFYDRSLGGLFSIAIQLRHITGEIRRTQTVAELAGMPYGPLLERIANRPASRDVSAHHARRVRACARRRRLMALAARLYNGAAMLGAGEILVVAQELEIEATVLRDEVEVEELGPPSASPP